MTNIQTFVVERGTPELAICARRRANAFSVLEASFEQELRSLELFVSDQSHGVVLVAKADGEPIGACLLVESEIERNHGVLPWLAGLFVVPEHRRKGARRRIGSSDRGSSATARVFAALSVHHTGCRVLSEARLVSP